MVGPCGSTLLCFCLPCPSSACLISPSTAAKASKLTDILSSDTCQHVKALRGWPPQQHGGGSMQRPGWRPATSLRRQSFPHSSPSTPLFAPYLFNGCTSLSGLQLEWNESVTKSPQQRAINVTVNLFEMVWSVSAQRSLGRTLPHQRPEHPTRSSHIQSTVSQESRSMALVGIESSRSSVWACIQHGPSKHVTASALFSLT